jgi:glycosyltransferase involved in cell wall biosynthesis
MISNRDIIVVGLQPWESEIGSNCKNIAIEFAKQNRVLYVNHPLDRITLLKKNREAQYRNHFEILKGQHDNLKQVQKNIWTLYPLNVLESANWIPLTFLFRAINKINNRRFAADIQKGIKRLGFKNYILFNDSDMFRSFHLKEILGPALSIYYSRDNLMGVPYWYKHGHLMEPELFAKSDIVVANSTYLAEMARPHNPHSYYVGQGCEIDEFDNNKVHGVPEDIASVGRPIIGYIGALFDLRLDIGLLETLAAEKPEWSFVFVGPEDEVFKKSMLHTLSNVHFLGRKEIKDLPCYLARFDVAINPQKLNPVTIGNYPRKIDEYLAMGKAVVATETAAMRIFDKQVYFASTAAEYTEKIQKALLENSVEKEVERMAFARSHTWENSVAEIYRAMVKVKPDLKETMQVVSNTN